MTIEVLVSCTRANLINSCLESLAKQTHKPDNVIVVIRDFDKDSQNAINAFKKNHFLAVKEVIVSKPGTVMAANAGIQASNSDILCFIDDDAQARPNWLERIEKYYKDENVGGVGGRDVVKIGSDVIEKRVKHIGQITWYGKIIGNHHYITDKAQQVLHLKGCNMSYRRKLLSLLDEKLSSNQIMAEPLWEVEIGFMIREKGYKILYDPEIIVDHYPATLGEEWRKRKSVSIHNETYILLKRLAPFNKFVYILCAFLIGAKENLGFARWIIESFSNLGFKRTWFQLLNDLEYKIKGIRDYLAIKTL